MTLNINKLSSDLRTTKKSRKATYKKIAEQTGLSWLCLLNIVNPKRKGCNADTFIKIVGWIGTVLTNTFYPMAMVFPQGFQMEDPDHVGFDWKRHVKETSRALICLFFQNLLWCGGFNIVENNMDRGAPKGGAFEKQLDRYRKDFVYQLIIKEK